MQENPEDNENDVEPGLGEDCPQRDCEPFGENDIHEEVEDQENLSPLHKDQMDVYHKGPVLYWVPTPAIHTCKRCRTAFTSKNKLHEHLRERNCSKAPLKVSSLKLEELAAKIGVVLKSTGSVSGKPG